MTINKYELPKLNYKYDDFEPFFDSKTMEIHFTKHHKTYVTKLNASLEKISWEKNLSVENLISNLKDIPEEIRQSVRDNGGGHANHNLFWSILTPKKEKNEIEIPFEIKSAISKTFESFEKFQEKLTNCAMNHVGSGWAWLFLTKENELEIGTTINHDSPLMSEFCHLQGKPILVIDLWEHAYYLKYQNRRAEYLTSFWQLINWEKVNQNFIKSSFC